MIRHLPVVGSFAALAATDLPPATAPWWAGLLIQAVALAVAYFTGLRKARSCVSPSPLPSWLDLPDAQPSVKPSLELDLQASNSASSSERSNRPPHNQSTLAQVRSRQLDEVIARWEADPRNRSPANMSDADPEQDPFEQR